MPLAGAFLTLGLAQNAKNPFLGRWDITVTTPKATYPDWIEVSEKDGKLAAHVQPRGGGAVWASDVKLDGNRLAVTLPAAAAPLPSGS